ncbi:MAG: CotH kinase family protein [Clostridia bacterium]|nr:CotH kinase family protein [Clostridia bacterium]
MSTSKHIDKICIAAVAIMLVVTILFMCGNALGLTVQSRAVKYESTLFDTSYVHQIDIVMNDWDAFIESCENEEYAVCTAVIDGNKQTNVAIRAKGNTSLSSVRSSGSQRYSFKLEFDHFEDGKTYDGLDKLCLNNLIQDNTMMKDYIAYYLMNDFGADSPLCSFAYITVNGEDWGLYLAVEGIEDSFLSRSYGSEAGELYKPDSMSFGGGRGNGKDFNMDDFDFSGSDDEDQDQDQNQNQAQDTPQQGAQGSADSDDAGSAFPGFPGSDGTQMPEGMTPPDGFSGSFPGFSGDGAGQESGDTAGSGDTETGDGAQTPAGMTPPGGFGGGFGGGMGSDDVKLKYIDDDPDSYSNIFDNAKTDVSNADKKRLIASLEKLSSYTDLESVLDTDEVLRYFVVHNFVCNGDSYTGMMIHNYYLHESDGQLSMIPWDYNLAFGTFQGGDASGTVNTSIDSPISMGNVDDRPMLGWIFSDESYTEQYHKLFSEFIEKWFTNGELEQLIADTAEMIRPYVEKDPTKFCTTEDFDKGVAALSQFVSLRGEAVERQLAGDDTAVDTGTLNLSDMGSMGGGMGKGDKGGMGGFSGSFSPLSMLKLTDSDGNEVAVSDVIEDVSAIVSLTLSDGTTLDLSSGERMKTLMKADAATIVSATDQDGNTTDLSEYKVSFSSSSGRSGGAKPDAAPAGDGETEAEADAQEQAQPPAAPQAQAGEDSTAQTDAKRSERPSAPNETDRQQFRSGGNSTATYWILCGASIAVLALGLLIAFKKKA